MEGRSRSASPLKSPTHQLSATLEAPRSHSKPIKSNLSAASPPSQPSPHDAFHLSPLRSPGLSPPFLFDTSKDGRESVGDGLEWSMSKEESLQLKQVIKFWGAISGITLDCSSVFGRNAALFLQLRMEVSRLDRERAQAVEEADSYRGRCLAAEAASRSSSLKACPLTHPSVYLASNCFYELRSRRSRC
jgi:hypothetical protein